MGNRRIVEFASEEERQRWRQAVAEEEAHAPEYLAEHRRREELAAAEPTLSGQLRRAIRDSGIAYPELAAQTGLHPGDVGAFMVGYRPLDSDAFDRLTCALQLQLAPIPQGAHHATPHD